MASKYKDIIDGFKLKFESFNGVAFELNPDSAISASNEKTIIVMRDDDSPDVIYSPLGGNNSVGYQAEIDLEIYVYNTDASVRENDMDQILTALDQALQADIDLGGLIEGMTYSQPDTSTEKTDSTVPAKRANFSVSFEYYTATPLS